MKLHDKTSAVINEKYIVSVSRSAIFKKTLNITFLHQGGAISTYEYHSEEWALVALDLIADRINYINQAT